MYHVSRVNLNEVVIVSPENGFPISALWLSAGLFSLYALYAHETVCNSVELYINFRKQSIPDIEACQRG